MTDSIGSSGAVDSTDTNLSRPPSAAAGPVPVRRLGPALTTLFALQLMLVTDTTIVNVALPAIGRQLALSDTALAWVVTTYALAFGGLILVSGKIGTRVGVRRALTIGTATFTIASAAGGLAQEPTMLLAARACQGLGAALAAPSILVLIMSITSPGPQRARAMSYFVLATGVGAAAGLVLGGILTDAFGWRSVMFVNVPVGVMVAVAALTTLPELPTARDPLDVAGAIASSLGMLGLVYGFTTAAERGWATAEVTVPLGVAVVALTTLMVIEARSRYPVIPLSFFARMRSAAPLMAMTLVPGGQVGFLYFATLYSQRVLDHTPLQTGLLLLPFTGGLVVTNLASGRLVPRFGERVVGSIGLGGLAVATALLAYAVREDGSAVGFLLASTVLGLGAGLTFAPLTGVIMGQAPKHLTAPAASLTQGAQQLGGALGLAILVSVLGASTTLADGLQTALLVTALFPLAALLLFTTWARRVTARE